MDKQSFKEILGEMFEPIRQDISDLKSQFDTVEKRIQQDISEMKSQLNTVEKRNQRDVSDLKSQLNTVEKRILELNTTVYLLIKQNAAETGELRIKVARVKDRLGMQ